MEGGNVVGGRELRGRGWGRGVGGRREGSGRKGQARTGARGSVEDSGLRVTSAKGRGRGSSPGVRGDVPLYLCDRGIKVFIRKLIV